jgi:RNA polymerase sigma-70 factor (ECF subfamily)
MSETAQFTQLIKDNEGILFKVTSVYTDDYETKQDLYQEIVLQLWKSFDAFNGESKWSTWMYRIALNTAITYMRKAKKKKVFVPLDQTVLNYSESTDHEFEERLKTLYAHIKMLNTLEKGIILLFLEDKNYEEISSITGLTVTNVASRLSRIKMKLKEQITNKS